MASEKIRVTKSPSLVDEIDNYRNQIRCRAYELFCEAGRPDGQAEEHWMQAEQELFLKPDITVTEKENGYEATFPLMGVDPKDLEVVVAPAAAVVAGAQSYAADAASNGASGVSERSQRKLYQEIYFPKEIDVNSVKAEIKNGTLQLKANVIGAAKTRRVRNQKA